MIETLQPTRERIIDAAMRVFAREGLHGATTRGIAQEAEVNEVTLFRHFQNKEGLLTAVMTHAVTAHHGAWAGDETEWTGDLKQNLRRFAEGCYHMMSRDEPFLRTMVGEARRHPEHARKVIMDAVKPMREGFIAKLEAARKAGLVRKGLDLGIACDAFTAMLFTGMLRNTAGCSWGYSAQDYVATCADIFAAGLAPG